MSRVRDGRPAQIIFLQTNPGSGRALQCRNSAASRAFGNVVRKFQATKNDAELDTLFAVLCLWLKNDPLDSLEEQMLASSLIPVYEKGDWNVLESGEPIYFATTADSIIVDSEAYSIRERLLPSVTAFGTPPCVEPSPPNEPPPSHQQPSEFVSSGMSFSFAPGQPLQSRLL